MLFALFPAIPMVLSGCIWRQYFELGWDEEVELHDGRTILVHVTHTYERTSRWRRYDTAIHRDTELRFDAGDGIGTVNQLFMSFIPMFLDQDENIWYAVLYGGYSKRTREIPGQDWGDADSSPYGQLAIKLDRGKWTPISMSSLPEKFKTPNMLLLHGAVSQIAELDGTRVTLERKRRWRKDHPPGYADVRLARPVGKDL